jgi:hypothetical protein
MSLTIYTSRINFLNTVFGETAHTDSLKSKLKYEGFSRAVIQFLWEEEGLGDNT